MTGPIYAWIIIGGLIAVLASVATAQVTRTKPLDCGKIDPAVCAVVRELNERITKLESKVEAMETPRVQPLR